ncbi:MAG TPA: hypothetical protein VI306_16815 [Pyrinomonadaceae bacterium]
MYCPSCGSEERQLSQFCRACGTDLRIVRTTLERPDAVTASAISAREQISRAFADRIREAETGHDLEHIAEDVLPQFEKFFESPEERRLRRVRAGVITATVGLGYSIIALIMSFDKAEFFPFITPGFIAFLVGLGLVINGLLFTVPKKILPGSEDDALAQKILDSTNQYQTPQIQARATTNELTPAQRNQLPSITEHTTHHLQSRKS